jgi:hypothetical protein
MLRAYDVRFIILSDMELTMYSEEGIGKFQRMEQMGLLSIAYQHGVGMVFEVNREVVDTFMVQQLKFNDAIGLVESALPAYAAPGNAAEFHRPDMNVDVAAALKVLSTFELPYVFVSNPPRILEYQTAVYDRLLVLEDMGVLIKIDDLDSGRSYHINQDVLMEIMGEDS